MKALAVGKNQPSSFRAKIAIFTMNGGVIFVCPLLNVMAQKPWAISSDCSLHIL